MQLKNGNDIVIQQYQSNSIECEGTILQATHMKFLF